MWTEEEDVKLFKLYKVKGSIWSLIAEEFPGRTRNEVKNRFYSTLRRIATKKNQDNAVHLSFRRKSLLQYIDDAIEYGHSCSSKRGRKRKHPVKTEGKEITKDCAKKNIQSLVPIPSFPLCGTISGTSPVGEEFSITFEELLRKEEKCMGFLKQRAKLPLGSLGSAFVPFNKSASL